MKNRFYELLKSTKRTGIENLVIYMEAEEFDEAPCSGKHHLSKQGGLLEHSLNVYEATCKLAEALEVNVSKESIIICALLHDLGKMGDYGKPNYVANILKSGKRSDAEPYKTNKDLLYIPHEIRSIAIAERYIDLTEEEEFAILYHNGMYGDLRYALSGKETPLYMLLHFADMWCSRVVEVEDGTEV